MRMSNEKDLWLKKQLKCFTTKSEVSRAMCCCSQYVLRSLYNSPTTAKMSRVIFAVAS